MWSHSQNNPVLVEAVVDLQMQGDTGASVFIISYSTYIALRENPLQIQNCQTKLITYTREEIEALGKLLLLSHTKM